MNIFFSIETKCIPYYEITVRPADKDFKNSEIRSLIRVRYVFGININSVVIKQFTKKLK